MVLKFYNSLTLKKEEFIPINKDKVTLYTCGPTVYNYPHIGNYRCFVFADILKRALSYSGYNVDHIMNITDIDDKTIRDSIKEGKSLLDFTQFYTDEFFKDRDMLSILPPRIYTKATDYVLEMLQITEKLIENGNAYTTEDGSAYFDIKKDKEYGKLSHFKLSDLKDNASGRLKKDEYEKENAQDFALWKAWDENDGDVFWIPSDILGHETKLAKGRPGWHIECSAMSIATLGEQIDIHTGGIDNMFPHHENEIAQSEGATGKEFVKYWLHCEHLMVDGKKMAKSAGNFYTLRDLIEKGIDPIAFRYWLYTGHYKTKVNFTLESVEGAQTALERLYDKYEKLGKNFGSINTEYKNKFLEFIQDDLNTPRALALVWDLLNDESINNADKKSTFQDFDKVLGFGLADISRNKKKQKEMLKNIPEEVLNIASFRETARANKDYAQSDKLRDQILKLGYEIKDTESGTEFIKI